MNVYTSSELASRTKAVCDAARTQGCAYISTNGKIDLMMVDLSDFETLNDAVRSFDEWTAMRTLRNIWSKTAARPLSDEEIEQEIAAARSEISAS
ncbi:hypothetical protein [Arabiibacter massiliensis]|uniref:hypothetical protein n=1 Tax=Arabiibacter massiliensis TaxID=1870985 RepID=UPI00155A19D5|nr:hypothetical protein [Arabiibacter massiliensis]